MMMVVAVRAVLVLLLLRLILSLVEGVGKGATHGKHVAGLVEVVSSFVRRAGDAAGLAACVAAGACAVCARHGEVGTGRGSQAAGDELRVVSKQSLQTIGGRSEVGGSDGDVESLALGSLRKRCGSRLTVARLREVAWRGGRKARSATGELACAGSDGCGARQIAWSLLLVGRGRCSFLLLLLLLGHLEGKLLCLGGTVSTGRSGARADARTTTEVTVVDKGVGHDGRRSAALDGAVGGVASIGGGESFAAAGRRGDVDRLLRHGLRRYVGQERGP